MPGLRDSQEEEEEECDAVSHLATTATDPSSSLKRKQTDGKNRGPKITPHQPE